MKIVKENRISGYRSDVVLKSKNGSTIKRFSSTSGVDYAQADQNCYKRLSWFCRRAISYLKKDISYLDEYDVKLLKLHKVTQQDLEKVLKKISPALRQIQVKTETIEL